MQYLRDVSDVMHGEYGSVIGQEIDTGRVGGEN